MIFRNNTLIIFFIMFLSFACADTFTLKNGKTLKGTIIKEENDHILIKMNFGSSRLKKTDIINIQKDKDNSTPQEKLKKLLQKATGKDDFIHAADYAFENNLTDRGISILKRAWVIDNKKDSSLKKRIEQEKINELKIILEKASDHFKNNNYRLTASILHKNYKKFKNSDNYLVEYWGLKREVYKNIFDENTTREYLGSIINTLKPFSLKIVPVKKTRTRKSKKETSPTIDSASLRQKQKKLGLDYSSIIPQMTQIFQVKKHIKKNELDKFAVKQIHSKAELDKSRGNMSQFNHLKSENHNIYKSRRLIKKYNMLLKQLQHEYNSINEKLSNENTLWTKKGYQKICDEWIKDPNKIKKAQGLVLFHGFWLDQADLNFEKKKFEILKKLEEEKEKKEEQFNDKKLTQKLAKEYPKEPVKDLSEIENEFMDRSQKMAKKIEQAFNKESGDELTIKKSFKDYFKQKLLNKEEGLSILFGVPILCLLFILLLFLRKRR